MKPRHAAFTLIELLVTLTLIGILAALLTVGIRGGIAGANAAKCMGNLKQIYAAALLWSADNNGRIPPMNDSSPFVLAYNPLGGNPAAQNLRTLGILAPYLGHDSMADLKSVRDFPVIICPANTNKTIFGYGMNYNYLSWESNPTPIWKTFAQMEGFPGGLSKTVFWCDNEMLDPKSTSWHSYVRPPSKADTNHPSFRHPGKTANVLWLDGHVSAEKDDKTAGGWMNPNDKYWGKF